MREAAPAAQSVGFDGPSGMREACDTLWELLGVPNNPTLPRCGFQHNLNTPKCVRRATKLSGWNGRCVQHRV